MIRTILWITTALSMFLSTALAADQKPINVLIVTGDHGHAWKETTPFIKSLLEKAGMKVEVTEIPSKDLTTENLAKFDALLLNYKDTPKGAPESRWSDDNKKAFADAVRNGKGLLVYHHASSAFTSGDDWSKEFEKLIAGGWRKQGNHGKRHEYDVTAMNVKHPIVQDLYGEYPHSNDELYQNSLMFPESTVLATAWSDKNKDPKNTNKNEPVVWVSSYGKGRVCENVLGHDVAAMQSPIFQALLIRGVEWIATGDVKSPRPETLKVK
jgi:uncharacterized protein